MDVEASGRYRTEYYRCSCFLPNHFVHLWLDPPMDEWDRSVTIGIGSSAKTVRRRITEAWAVLRGRRECYDEIVLDLTEAERLYSDLGDHLEQLLGTPREGH